MAAPNFDAMSVRLSKMADDAVSAAASSGDRLTAAQREDIINAAHRRWMMKKIRILDATTLHVEVIDPIALQGYLGDEAQTLAANVKPLSTWTGGVAWIISARNSTTAVVKPLSQRLKGVSQAGGTSFVTASSTNQFYLIEGVNLRVLGSGATDSITLQYVKPHTALVTGGSSTTVVSDTSWSATGTAVTSFTGTLASHVGGTFTGLDNGGNPFTRTIVAYVSATAFTIDSALVANGAGTNGYITPLASADTLVPSQYWEEVMDEAYKVYVETYPAPESAAVLQLKS